MWEGADGAGKSFCEGLEGLEGAIGELKGLRGAYEGDRHTPLRSRRDCPGLRFRVESSGCRIEDHSRGKRLNYSIGKKRGQEATGPRGHGTKGQVVKGAKVLKAEKTERAEGAEGGRGGRRGSNDQNRAPQECEEDE